MTYSPGTANGIAYLNGSKVLTTGSALTFDGANLGIGTAPTAIGGGYATLAINGSSGSFSEYQQAGSGFFRVGSDSGVGGFLFTRANNAIRFGINDSEAMRLTSTGLGIGTSSPAFKLDVRGSSGTGISFIETSSGNSNRVQLGTGAGFGFINADAGAGSISLALQVSGSTRATLDSSGNLGLGVTPSAWQASLGKVIQLGTGASLVGDSGAPRLRSIANAYFDGSNWRYIADGYATYMYQNGITGETSWQQAPSGTAGNPISFTQAMTLFATGNHVVGQTNDVGYRVVAARGSGSGQLALTTAGLNGSNASPLNIDLDFLGFGDELRARIRAFDVSANSVESPLAFWTKNSSGAFAERARITSGGNLLVGTTVEFARLAVNGSIYAAAGNDIQVGNVNNTNAASINSDSTDTSAALVFKTAATGLARTERARITSAGDLLVGAQSSSGRLTVRLDSTTASPQYIVNAALTGTFIKFEGNGSVLGSITFNGTNTAYNTTSDYRLKTFIAKVTDSGSRLDALNPVEYEWKANGKRTRGFFAHEFQTVYADSVTGTKDAVDTEGKPVYQSMQASSSEVIADLVAEIQSLRARVAALESK